MSDIMKEVADLTKCKQKSGEDLQKYLGRLFAKANSLSDTDWAELSEDAQLWVNAMSDAKEAGEDELPPPPDLESDEDEDEEADNDGDSGDSEEASDDDEEAPAPSRAARRAAAKKTKAEPVKAAKGGKKGKEEPAPKKGRRAAAPVEADDEDEEEEAPKPSRRGSKKAEPVKAAKGKKGKEDTAKVGRPRGAPDNAKVRWLVKELPEGNRNHHQKKVKEGMKFSAIRNDKTLLRVTRYWKRKGFLDLVA